ncbi:MAG: ribosome recycling factor [Nitrospirae bacterium]|jgi:ribosome recycling factor|nr:MAG: ribosome recycling factor [Nitrospirota bacterium]
MAEFKKKATDKMEGQVEHLRHEFTGLRTGRASVALLDQVKVDYYGTPTPLKQVATLATPESRLITVQPFERTLMKDIEKAILASGLGLTPTNDGKLIRLPIPPLTEERRKDLVKVAKRLTEEVRVHIRNIRRDVLEDIKKAQKDSTLAEDDAKKAHDEIQKLTDTYMAKVDDLLKKKEAEITEI